MEVQVSKTKVWQTLREERLYPFHVQRVQALQPDDFPARVRLCEWLVKGLVRQSMWFLHDVREFLNELFPNRKLGSRWIPHLLTEEQKAARVNWCQITLDRFNSGNSKNVYSIVSGDESWIYSIHSRSVSKKMVATFVSKAGHIATIPLNEQRTVTADWYTTVCLPKVITELRKINPERRIMLHQDNVSSHTAQKTRQYLTEENVELLDHSLYSFDLSPNDFFTFPKIKNRLRGQRFRSPEEANKWFENWSERMQMCINLRGEYFEKQ
ncbi:unnamed protein product [Acanthoscelides obtectus]|uniref:Transposase n=1 Tax=Acanthoscelides obtectus TaxID=200917 RepID=A0A9P0KI12_ACAOB|nr:unnamed protein product [Acanthoscelides obtectus]CAK1625589.1 Mariner Mos1 transposase [Acanthoscelides obtectus]